jgi:uncharacterized membrane protein
MPESSLHNSAPSSDPASGHSAVDESLERALGWVLRIGVILSVLVCALGGFLLLHQQGESSGLALISSHAAYLSPAQVWQRTRNGSGAAIILIGLSLLLLTPVLRVAAMVFAFLLERDWLYAAISAVVLTVLGFGILFAR